MRIVPDFMDCSIAHAYMTVMTFFIVHACTSIEERAARTHSPDSAPLDPVSIVIFRLLLSQRSRSFEVSLADPRRRRLLRTAVTASCAYMLPDFRVFVVCERGFGGVERWKEI